MYPAVQRVGHRDRAYRRYSGTGGRATDARKRTRQPSAATAASVVTFFLTCIPDPCGRRLSGDLSGFNGALASIGIGTSVRTLGDATTGINRADSASEKTVRLSRPVALDVSGRLWTPSAKGDCRCDSSIAILVLDGAGIEAPRGP